MRRHADVETASFAALARLMQTVEDTTTLHRGGAAGLARVRRDGRVLETMIAEGAQRADWRRWLVELNASYVAARLTIGGVADMLGVTFGYLAATGEIATKHAIHPADTNSYNLADQAA
jgi:triphosphoribosyl-dephospho-CoA synthase